MDSVVVRGTMSRVQDGQPAILDLGCGSGIWFRTSSTSPCGISDSDFFQEYGNCPRVSSC
jgi:hypothetical protein